MREDEKLLGRHLSKAYSLKGEHQLAEYVANLDLSECTEILAASPQGLSFLASHRDECRVGPGERRSFEEVIRTWTMSVLSGVEAG
jgi:hypothetical protein